MDDDPYFIIKRKIITDQLYYLEPFTKMQAWIDMIRMANWDDGSFESGLDQINLSRGEFIHTEEHLAETWKWSRGKVRRFIKWCEKDDRLTVRKTVLVSGQTRNIVKLVNYGKHQFPIGDDGTSLDTSLGTSDGTQEKKKNKKKNIKNNISTETVREIIDDLNTVCKRGFGTELPKWKDLIQARFNENSIRSVDDFKKVHRIKNKQWKNDPEMSKYLRPSTLYGNKFEEYLNEKDYKTDHGWSEDLYNSTIIPENRMANKYQNPIANNFTTARKIAKSEIENIENAEELIRIWEKKYSESWRQDIKIKKMYEDKLAEFDV